MNKLIITIIILLFNHLVVFADTTLNYTPVAPLFDECPSEAGTNEGAGPRTKLGVPLSNSLSVSPSGSVTCKTHYYYSSSDQIVNFTEDTGITSCGPGKMYVTGTLSCSGGNCSMTCRDFDDTRPDYNTDINDITNPDILAYDSTIYMIEVDNLGEAPITIINAQKEDKNTGGLGTSFNMSCSTVLSTSTCTDIWDTSLVDNFRETYRGRDYTYRIVRICDEAGNCWNGPVDLIYRIYSNSLFMSGSIIDNDLINPTNIADGSVKNLTFKIEDVYENDIIPVSGISREINFDYDTDNSVYLDQYRRDGTGVYISTPSNPIYLPLIPIGTGVISINNQTSTDGIYNFKFKVYTPTRESYDKTDNSLHFLGVGATVADNIGGNFTGYNISNSSFSLRSLPIYYTLFSGSLISDGFIEGAVQDGNITIQKYGLQTTANNRLYFEFGSGNTNTVNSSLNLRIGATESGAINPVGEGNPNFSTYVNNFGLGNINFYTKLLLQTGATLDDIQNSYFSSHIGYDITGPNGGTINPIYNSDVYGKNYYWGVIGTGNTYASAVKVIGQTYSQKFNEIISGQSGDQVKLLNGNIIKSSLKTEVRKNAYNIIRNTPLSNSGNTIINSNFMLNPDGAKLLSGSILYFGGLNGSNVTLEGLSFEGNKTILIEGGNIYIRGDVDVTGDNSLLSIVVLKDSLGRGGNIYINPNVTYIKSVIYADKSLISYDGTNELDGNTSFSVLKNQLYILGSVFSENTVGGSRADPIECPYYIGNCISQEYAQKFDLNYLRRYYLKDTDYDGVGDTPVGGGISSFPSTSPNYKYPVVIEYNPLIQSNPPLIFRESK